MERRMKIYNALLKATEKSFISLFDKHHEHFYYASLIMMDVATPCITAISDETLERVLIENFTDENEKNKNRDLYKWSYADSPYIGFGFEEYFCEVDKLFYNDIRIANMQYDECVGRVNEWLEIMFEVMKELDKKGLFRFYNDRSKLFINAEQMPPDNKNLVHARDLNDDDIFSIWYEDNKEEYIW